LLSALGWFQRPVWPKFFLQPEKWRILLPCVFAILTFPAESSCSLFVEAISAISKFFLFPSMTTNLLRRRRPLEKQNMSPPPSPFWKVSHLLSSYTLVFLEVSNSLFPNYVVFLFLLVLVPVDHRVFLLSLVQVQGLLPPFFSPSDRPSFRSPLATGAFDGICFAPPPNFSFLPSSRPPPSMMMPTSRTLTTLFKRMLPCFFSYLSDEIVLPFRLGVPSPLFFRNPLAACCVKLSVPAVLLVRKNHPCLHRDDLPCSHSQPCCPLLPPHHLLEPPPPQRNPVDPCG